MCLTDTWQPLNCSWRVPVPVAPERRKVQMLAPRCFCQPLPTGHGAQHPTDEHHISLQGASPEHTQRHMSETMGNNFSKCVLKRMNMNKLFIRTNRGINYLWSRGGPGHDLFIHTRRPFTVVLEKQNEQNCYMWHSVHYRGVMIPGMCYSVPMPQNFHDSWYKLL